MNGLYESIEFRSHSIRIKGKTILFDSYDQLSRWLPRLTTYINFEKLPDSVDLEDLIFLYHLKRGDDEKLCT